MSIEKQTKELSGKFWISTTGYRILLILKSLMEKGRTIKELVEIVRNNKYANKAFSKDTIRLDILTLKAIGCSIKRPSKANKYKYELISHPFILKISKLELDVLTKIRNQLAKDISVEEVFVLNDLYDKIAGLTFNDFIINYINDTKPLINLDKDIYIQLSKIKDKKVQLTYKSPKFGKEKIEIIPQKVVYENEKVGLWCYSYKYQSNSMLNMEQILSVNKVDNSVNTKPSVSYNVIYEIYSDAINSFVKKDYENIIERTPEKIVINANVENEFLFIQRILQFGADFKIISPGFFKEKLIDKLKLIQKGYENEEA